MTVALMYHGIFPDGDTRAIDAEDLPYALSVSDFSRQLDILAERNTGLFSASTTPQIVISFDDGHVSNLHLATPLLVERNLSAYFFITTDFIDHRAGFMSRSELQELSMIPGMCIGSHGMTHRFFDDLSEAESLAELNGSRDALETICQSACRSISFPGGRFSHDTIQQLLSVGYTQFFGSDIGLIDVDGWQEPVATGEQGLADRWALRRQQGLQPLPRVAIRRNTQLSEFRRIIEQDQAYFRRKRIDSQLKHLARRVIGNRLYHGLYKSITAR